MNNRIRFYITLLILAALAAFTPATAQFVVGGAAPDSSAVLEVQGKNGGFLPPRMSTNERNAVQQPATGLLIYNATTHCMEVNVGTPDSPDWTMAVCRAGKLDGLDCSNPLLLGGLVKSEPAQNVSFVIHYTGGNGGVYEEIRVYSTGVSGLVAAASAGNLAEGDSSLTFRITGTPASAGIASFMVRIAGKSCSVSVPVRLPDAIVSDLHCGSYSFSSLPIAWHYNNIGLYVPYSGGNGGAFGELQLQSMDVTGLTASLSPGTLNEGAGILFFRVTGITNSGGTARFELTIGGKVCILYLPVNAPSGAVAALQCNAATFIGSLTSGIPSSVNNVIKLPYTGGNGGAYTFKQFTSTSVPGLTATLLPGVLEIGSGTLTFVITGTPGNGGFARFNLKLGDKNCNFQVQVAGEILCGAYIAPGVWKQFACYNLGALNMVDYPFTPSWDKNGGYWQWGTKDPVAPNPASPSAADANAGPIPGWVNYIAPDGAWQETVKGSEDPCPDFYRVPSNAELEGVVANNASSRTGTWTSGATNYTVGTLFGDALMLQAAGWRFHTNGELENRGSAGFYWSSTGTNQYYGAGFIVGAYASWVYTFGRDFGLTVRCIHE